MAPSKIDTTLSNGAAAMKQPAATPITAYRHLVPLTSQSNITYLNASFAPPSNLLVHAAIAKFNNDALYNPSPKPQWQAEAEALRGLLARYIKAESSAIALTRDTTEGLNSFIRGLKFKPGDNVVLLDSEHPNHAYAWMALRPSGLEVRQVPTITEAAESGRVVAANAETFSSYVDERTIAIGLSSVMFHSGQWNDLQGICDAYRPRGIHVIADLTQQVGFASVDVSKLNVSAAAFSLHKGLSAPTGLAALYVSPDIIHQLDPQPPVVGYGAVSNARTDLLVPADKIVYHPSARRYEHLNISLIAGVAAKAYLEFYLDIMTPQNVETHLYSLGDALRIECKKLGVKIIGLDTKEEHAPHLYILDLHDPRWMKHLKGSGIYVTPYRLGIRVSFGFYNNSADVERLVDVLRDGIERGIPLQ
ncbi:pyridoxal phosphate-dependent transferase [Aspergillus pseudoustus]|uniref:Pyridoxal phosphate-dependent transferase n=1 Tax=Aspergillus pseudoustus TaxID=1810923 RepID=A0ABR4JAA3_9EURO